MGIKLLAQAWRVGSGLVLATLLAACQLPWATRSVDVLPVARSLVILPLPTVGAAVTPGPIVALVVPPTPTPMPTLAADTADPTALIQRGEVIYREHCATCHQPAGQGQGAYPALAGNDFVTAADPAPVIETVLHGRGEMPAFSDTLSNQEIAAVISAIRNRWGNAAAAVDVAQVQSVAAAR